MADIQFDEEQSSHPIQQIEQKSFFVRLVLSTGIVSTDEQANYVLLGVVAFCIIIAIALPFLFGTPNPPPQTPASPSWPQSVSH